MDLFTHAATGVIAASPFLADRPALALGLVAGSVLPDLDVFYRLHNKRAFLRTHQTWTHALPFHLAASLGVGFAVALAGGRGFQAGAGLLAGLAGHSLLDTLNTFGVAWLAPFSQRRYCLEWVFFVDACVLAATTMALVMLGPGWMRGEPAPPAPALAFFGFLLAYAGAKGLLRQRILKWVPGAASAVPSALFPWRFLVPLRDGDTLRLVRVNAITGRRSTWIETRILDEQFAKILAPIPEYATMRRHSSAYHVISMEIAGGQTRLLCRDMRIRNFRTRFGDLEIWLNAEQQVIRTRFYA